MALRKIRFQKTLVSNQYQYIEQKNGSTPAIVWQDEHNNTFRAMIISLDFCNSEEIYKSKVIVDVKPAGLTDWTFKDTYDLIDDKNNYRNSKTGKLIPNDKAYVEKKTKVKGNPKPVITRTLIANVVTGGKYFTENLLSKSHSLFDLLFSEIAEKEGI